jgi:hypothetical protein
MKLRIAIIVFCLPLLGLGQVIEEVATTAELPDICIIDFYKGIVDKVQLGSTTIKEVFELYGATNISRRKIPFSIDMGGGYSIKTINYPWLGLTFEFNNKRTKFKFKKRKLSIITILEPCPCKSKDGLGIGSFYNEIMNFSYIINSREGKYTVSEEFKGEKGGEIFFFISRSLTGGKSRLITFRGFYQEDASKFKAEKIEIRDEL